jgi:hypothetical protein
VFLAAPAVLHPKGAFAVLSYCCFDGSTTAIKFIFKTKFMEEVGTKFSLSQLR